MDLVTAMQRRLDRAQVAARLATSSSGSIFIAAMQREGMPVSVARLILRHANTYQRLAVRECNGDDWQSGDLVPCPSDERAPSCPICDGTHGRHDRVTRSSVRMGRCQALIQQIVADVWAPVKYPVVFSGDPRGACVRLVVPSGKSDWGNSHNGLCVPTRRY